MGWSSPKRGCNLLSIRPACIVSGHPCIYTLVCFGCPLSAPTTVQGGIFKLRRPRLEDSVRRLTLVLASCTLPLATLPAGAQQRAMTLAEALTLAERNAPLVVQARGNVRSAGAVVRAAWGSFLPTVNSSASYGSSFSDGPSRTDPITGEIISGSSTSSSLSLGGSAFVDLFTGFSRGANLSSTRASRTEADAALVFQTDLGLQV